MKRLIILLTCLIVVVACNVSDSQEAKDSKTVDAQQAQYAKGQPVPMFDWSFERDLVIKLYNIRNQKVATHSVWRSDYGTIEGDCPSMGYGIPYDVSLTNPLKATDEDEDGYDKGNLTSIGQPEPNGVFASENTSATWVMCIGERGLLEPHYVETKVTVYPGPVKVDYENNRVVRSGQAAASIAMPRQ